MYMMCDIFCDLIDFDIMFYTSNTDAVFFKKKKLIYFIGKVLEFKVIKILCSNFSSFM